LASDALRLVRLVVVEEEPTRFVELRESRERVGNVEVVEVDSFVDDNVLVVPSRRVGLTLLPRPDARDRASFSSRRRLASASLSVDIAPRPRPPRVYYCTWHPLDNPAQLFIMGKCNIYIAARDDSPTRRIHSIR
jgi:hypothetical protein